MMAFYEMLLQVLRLEDGKWQLEDELSNSLQWDSMTQLVIAAWIHQETGNIVSVEELKSAKTVGDLKAIYDARL
jgi:acyl carrier protein